MNNEHAQVTDKGCKKTKLALLWMNLSNEPLVVVYTLIPILLRREMGATGFQIALFTMLSPVLSVFSFYWGSWVVRRKNKLLPNLIGAWVLARIPFIFFPYIDSFWKVFACCAIYQLFSRASTPALMEILKRNIPKKNREYTFSLYHVLSVVEGVLIGILLTQFLTVSGNNWKLIFVICGLISSSSVILQLRIKLPQEKDLPIEAIKNNFFLEPLKESFRLMRARPDFAIFQWAFMIGGFALMIVSPVKSIFIADVLPVSLADMTIARCVFVGVGMAGSSLIWRKALELFGIHQLTMWILLGFGLYPLALLLASTHISWFYLAHLLYGIAQGGSHLIWNLSGTIFSKDQNSVSFTTVNVLMIGLRGAVGPMLGSFLCSLLGPVPVFILGALIAFSGVWLILKWKARQPATVS